MSFDEQCLYLLGAGGNQSIVGCAAVYWAVSSILFSVSPKGAVVVVDPFDVSFSIAQRLAVLF